MSDILSERKKLIYISFALVVLLVLVGLFYFYLGALNLATPSNLQGSNVEGTSGKSSGTSSPSPTTSPTPSPPTEPTKPDCVCDWKNKECGGILSCKSDGVNHWEKICSCDPPGCGAQKGINCGNSGEGAMSCSQENC